MRLHLIAMLALAATPALAQRPDATKMTCRDAASLVLRQGAVVMGLGGQTYDRLVRDDSFCYLGQYTKPQFAPTLDNKACLVGWYCKDKDVYSN